LCPCLSFFFFSDDRTHQDLPSFPTRRSSDLLEARRRQRHELFLRVSRGVDARRRNCVLARADLLRAAHTQGHRPGGGGTPHRVRDRKSTRLNSSHDQISYAVFCLKKKNNNKT